MHSQRALRLFDEGNSETEIRSANLKILPPPQSSSVVPGGRTIAADSAERSRSSIKWYTGELEPIAPKIPMDEQPSSDLAAETAFNPRPDILMANRLGVFALEFTTI